MGFCWEALSLQLPQLWESLHFAVAAVDAEAAALQLFHVSSCPQCQESVASYTECMCMQL